MAADAATASTASLEVRTGPRGLRLRWRLAWGSACTTAVLLPITLERRASPAEGLFVPGLYYGWEDMAPKDDELGHGAYPRLDPIRGFAVRADRLPQPAIAIGGPDETWILWTSRETPTPSVPGLLYALWCDLDEAGRVRLGVRYPQAEHGHVPGAPGLAYLAKGVVGPGEDRHRRWRSGDRLTVDLELWRLDGPPSAHVGTVARDRWQRWRSHWSGEGGPLDGARSRARWVERHLWSPAIGQFESPEGSGVAMAGFVETSLTAACVVVRLGGLGSADDERRVMAGHGLSALEAWLTDGVRADGLLMPIRDAGGFSVGRRTYSGAASLGLAPEPVVETIRPTLECRSVLGLLRQLGVEGLGSDTHDRWRASLLASARWLLARRSGGVLPSLVSTAAALDMDSPDDLGSASLVSLLCDLSLDERDAAIASELMAAATDTYARSIARRAGEHRFGGVTLDAACPDREAAVASLEASLAMFEATGEESYLHDAQAAADVVLSYVFTYAISTFPGGTDARERDLSTIGASLVSPENQHLDPFPVGVPLVKYGLYARDRAALAAGVANVAWCLDGRWAIREGGATKQPEQLCHTAWHYDAYLTQRGDFRRGMPCFGLATSEHGWPQALPLLAFLELGHVTVDWPTGRVASVRGVRPRTSRLSDGLRITFTSAGPAVPTERPMLLRVLRPPHDAVLRVTSADGSQDHVWPSTLAVLVVDRIDEVVDLTLPVDRRP